MTDTNDSRLKIIKSDDDDQVIELCGIRISGSLWSDERAVIGVELSEAFDEHLYIELVTLCPYNDTSQALSAADAVKTIRAYCKKR